MTTIERFVRFTRHADIARPLYFRGPSESVGGRYQHVWSLIQREAWFHGRGERLRILAPHSTQTQGDLVRDHVDIIAEYWRD
jgi:hypothetical protein